MVMKMFQFLFFEHFQEQNELKMPKTLSKVYLQQFIDNLIAQNRIRTIIEREL